MAIIQKIQSLKHPGTLNDFRWPAEMAEFGRFNLIYGWNGTGKTTISRIFRAVEKRRSADYEVVLSIRGRRFSGSDFEHVNTSVRVFNRDFISDNVFPTDGTDMSPILVLGEDNVQKQQEVECLREKHALAEESLQTAVVAKKNATKALEMHCFDRGKAIKEMLRSSAESPYNNYNKSSYRQCAEKLKRISDPSGLCLTDSERDSLLKLHQRVTAKEKIDEITYSLPDLSALVGEVSSVLDMSVISSAIETLKDDQQLSSWVHHGLGLHQTRQSDVCLFCEQKLPEDRLRILETHFSAGYEQFMRSLDDQITNIKKAIVAAGSVTLPRETDFDDQLIEEFKNAANEFTRASEVVTDFLGVLVVELEKKKGQPFHRYVLSPSVPVVNSDVVDQVNRVVRKHNRACDEFENRIQQARKRLEYDSVLKYLEDFNRLVADEVQFQSDNLLAAGNVECLTKAIAALESEIIEHRKPAEELNEELHRYLGHSDLELAVKDNGYEIVRNGEAAQALSEGECTAIALLYFLKSLQGQDFDPSNGVVVLDDPVSSLDANALFLAFGFIRRRTRDVGQLFVLTHNFTLFRNVKNWFNHLKGQKKREVGQRPARFYMLQWRFDSTQRTTELRPLDPLLEEYNSEYHYIFSRIYKEAYATSPTALEHNYILPNMARRLLEGFLAFRRPQASGLLWSKLEDVGFDEAAKLRIIRFTNTFSHGDSVGEPEHDLSLLAESRSVLQDVLSFMEHLDVEHFRAMVQLIKGSVHDADSAQ